MPEVFDRFSGRFLGLHYGHKTAPRLAAGAPVERNNVSHEAATPGLEVTAAVGLVEVDGRRLIFAVGPRWG
jgi:hypothetical protein